MLMQSIAPGALPARKLVRLAATSSHLIEDIGLTPANDVGPRRISPIVGW